MILLTASMKDIVYYISSIGINQPLLSNMLSLFACWVMLHRYLLAVCRYIFFYKFFFQEYKLSLTDLLHSCKIFLTISSVINRIDLPGKILVKKQVSIMTRKCHSIGYFKIMKSFSIFRCISLKKIKKSLSNVLNTFENIM